MPVPDPDQQKLRREHRDALLVAAAAELAADEELEAETQRVETDDRPIGF